MARAGTWVTITVKVAKEEANVVDPWTPPSAPDVAAEVRERMEGLDLDTGWTIVSVSS